MLLSDVKDTFSMCKDNKEKYMDQNYSLFTLIFKGVHEPSGLFTVIVYFFKMLTNLAGLFPVIAYFFKVFTNLRFHTGWSILQKNVLPPFHERK